MWSHRIEEYGKPLVRAEGATPKPQGTEVVVRTTACGVCHSDLHYWHGGYELGAGRRFTLADRGVTPPITMGHEPFGIVDALGPEAVGVEVGDARAVYPWIGCGSCRHCRDGRDIDCANMRTIGLFTPGGYGSHIVVPHSRYLLPADGIPPERAATLSCAGLTAWSALKKAGPPHPRDALVLIGAGGVGLSAVGLARALHEGPLLVVDKDPAKLEAARTLGAEQTFTTGEEGATERIREATGDGAGAVIDFVGAPDTFRLSLDIVRRGARIVLIGLYGGSTRLPLPILPLRNVSVIGSLTGTVGELRELLEFVRTHDVASVPITRRPFSEASATLADLEAGRITGRVVLTE